MKLYTDRVVAVWIGVTAKRVRQLRDEGVLEEKQPGLYDLQTSVARYISYIRKGSGNTNLNDERALLTKAKREAADMENATRRGELHRTEDIERGIKALCLNMRSRFLSLPAKLSPQLATMGGDQAGIFDTVKAAIDETLEELTDYSISFAETGGEDDEQDD